METTSLETTIAEVIAAGFLVNNLFQCNTAQWQANLRNATGATEFGIGSTPTEALEICMTKLNDLVPFRERDQRFTIEGPRPSLSALIRTNAPASTLIRRF